MEMMALHYQNDLRATLVIVNHPSIKLIKSRKKEEQTFTFNYKLRKRHNKMIFRQKFCRKTKKYLLDIFIIT